MCGERNQRFCPDQLLPSILQGEEEKDGGGGEVTNKFLPELQQ